jgi:hypothetical protein
VADAQFINPDDDENFILIRCVTSEKSQICWRFIQSHLKLLSLIKVTTKDAVTTSHTTNLKTTHDKKMTAKNHFFLLVENENVPGKLKDLGKLW